MSRVVMYTTPWCPFCVSAKVLLQHKGISFEEIDVSHDEAVRTRMMEESGRRTVPQIFIDGAGIGGFQELRDLEARGELDHLLAA